MARLTKALEKVSLEGLRAGSHAEFSVTVVEFGLGEWEPRLLVVLEQLPIEETPLWRDGPIYWPAIAALLDFEWGSFTCVERERGMTQAPHVENALIEVVEFRQGLATWTDNGDAAGALRRRPIAMTASSSRLRRSAQPVGPYLAGLLKRAGYDMPACYIAGEPPERAVGTESPNSK